MTETPNITQQKMWRRFLTYNIQWQEEAINDLKKIDRQIQKKIIARIKNYLSKDPQSLGKPLQGIFKGLYRYRYGSYRIMYAIDRESVVILILRIADRKDVYENPVNKN
jgi:mRNA interferase RelE/StbE